MVILTTAALVDAALGLVLDKSAGGVVGAALKRLKERSARRELAAVVATAVDAAAAHAPSLESGLREEAFVHDMVTPIVLELIEDPSRLPDGKAVAMALIASLLAAEEQPVRVGPDLRRMLVDRQTELEEALVVFADALRHGFNRSESWRDVAHRQVTEAINTNVVELVRRQIQTATPTKPVEAEDALRDTVAGSAELRGWPRDVWGAQIERPEFEDLLGRIRSEPAGETFLVGEAGSGKSALLAAVVERLEAAGVPILGIKADRLPADVRTLDDVSRALGMRGNVAKSLRALAAGRPAVLLIDQLDAVSEVMDKTSERMRLLLRLVEEVHPRGPHADRLPVHVVVSSRPFEADHDARFARFEAERMVLRLPSLNQVDAALSQISINPVLLPEALRETVRRPFALKLFVGIIKRDGRVDDLLPSRLLNRWLDSADLGDSATRQEVARLLTSLAEEMVRTETLWRPVDVHEFTTPEALRRAVAAGLLIVDADRVGFSHQSWLDDFQARSLADAKTLAKFAWRGQDGLFTRASVLRGLQRLRSYEPDAYDAAIDMLLGEGRTRRHLRHLVVDLLAGQEDPKPREAAWIEHLLRTDPALAKRAVPLVAIRWSVWRAQATGWLPFLMNDEEMRGVVELLLAAEAKMDPEAAFDLIDRHWADAAHDDAVLLVIERARLWTARAAARLTDVLGRSAIAPHFVSHVGGELLRTGRAADAIDVVATYLEAVGKQGSGWSGDIYGLENIVEADPLAFTTRLLPAFVTLASRGAEAPRSAMKQFAESPALDRRWQWKEQGSPFEGLRAALRLSAEHRPGELARLLKPFHGIEVEAVQTVIADALAAGGQALAAEGCGFLLADPRRFDIGDATGGGEDGVIRTVHGWSSRQLVKAVAPHLAGDGLRRLREGIEGWNRYSSSPARDTDAKFRRMMLGWAEEARLALLAELPDQALDARRRRQVKEWRAVQPRFRGSMNSLQMASFVGPPMSAESMGRATDDQVVAIIEDRHDDAEERHDPRRPYVGGARHLAQAFGVFAKTYPDRAMSIIETRLIASRHEAVAGKGLRELAGVEEVKPGRVASLIHRLADNGFASQSWRNDAGWAFHTLAGRQKGLRDEDAALLESWIEDNPDIVAGRVQRRLDAAAESDRRNARTERPAARPLLFGPGGGHVVLPQGNFTFLDAIGQGLLLRLEPDVAGFTDILLRHVERAEDPAVWSQLLLSYGQTLWSMRGEDARALLRAILNNIPEAYDDPTLVRVFWQARRRVPDDVMDGVLLRWLAGSDALRQVAGELVGGLTMVSGGEDSVSWRAAPILSSGASPERTGFAFSAVAAWTEGDPGLRERAHASVITLAGEADVDLATATAMAFSKLAALSPDERTRELLKAVAANPIALNGALGHWLLDSLGALLVNPGFDGLILDVLAAAVELRGGAPARLGARGFGMGDDMVRIAIALQRTGGPVRPKAMDVYERLLDAHVYGAAQAAEASLR